ncbi:B12-binding domain-containing radical SAM protein [Candidatus Woesearchaeota archaeon CG11_big_fil_rev_8_21_14_0_20_43_8]|nr:MAG: B12-binding domain-containing radical SAM protein [Candidatus Woesearchaeota archaeon CG11_big_fil_rev_8_21_14_0_20_43_8]
MRTKKNPKKKSERCRVVVLNPPSRHAKNVVRDLVYGCWCKGKRIAAAKFPPTTLLQIATVLENEPENEMILLDSQADDLSFEIVRKKVSEVKPQIIIFPTSTMSFKEDAQTMRELKDDAVKDKRDLVILSYGSHVTFLPESSLLEDSIDYIVMKEPEYILRDFVRAYRKGNDVSSIGGLGFRTSKGIKINPPYPFIKDLDDMPFINREHIKMYAYFNPLVRRLPWTTMVTSRGCPGRCNFCSSPSFYGNVLRFRSAESVVNEMVVLYKMGYREIFFRDETFTAHRKRLVDICDLIIKKKLDMAWICNARVGNLDKKTMKIMKDAGCHTIKFGVESGVQEILNNIHKGIDVNMTKKTFKWTHEVGLDTHAHTMVGCIGETSETVRRTIEFLKEIGPTTLTAGAFTPYPGTEIFEMVKKKDTSIGDGTDSDLSTLHTQGYHSKELCDLSDEQVGKAVRKIYSSFYLRPSYVFKRLISIRSFTDIRRLLFAGLEVISFAAGRDDE